MKRFYIALSAVLLQLSVTQAQSNAPTMGWASWNTYGVNINENLIRSQADAMVSTGLNTVGYSHINIDDGYFGGRDANTGELITHPTRFPNGLKGVVDYIHSKGLKAGIYSDAGRNTCGSFSNNDTLAIGAGLYGHDQQDADYFFKKLGFDFIKIDYCGGSYGQNVDHLVLDEKERYTDIATAIRNTGRTDVQVNACRWSFPGTWVSNVAFSWRTTGDIYDAWESVRNILAENLYLSAYSSEGHYNDMDMLEVGRSMSEEEDKTHFGLWCMMNSPLLIGCDLTTIKPRTLALLKNAELIALNQDPVFQQAYVVGLTNNCHILVKDIEQRNGTKRAFAVYNPSDEERKVTVSFADLCLAGKVKLRDVFERKDVGSFSGTCQVTVPAHGTRIYVAHAQKRTDRVRYEAETAYISDYQELKNNQDEGTGIYQADANCSSGYKASWLGNKADNDLVWRNVYAAKGGKRTLTIAFSSKEERTVNIDVNGQRVKTMTVSSGDWTKVATESITINLNKGDNTIRLSNANGWMPDIDYIDVK